MAQESGTRPHLRPVSAVVDFELCVCSENLQAAVSEGYESEVNADHSPSICAGIPPDSASICDIQTLLPQ